MTEDNILSWTEIKHYIHTGELPTLRRSQSETAKYHKHKDYVRDVLKLSMHDYVLKKLDWKQNELDELNNVKYPTNDDKIQHSFSKEDYYKVTVNDFPYKFEPRVVHLLVWSKIKLPIYMQGDEKDETMTEKIDEFFAKTLNVKFDMEKERDYAWFINYVSLQSIKAISHVHLLIRLPDNHPKFHYTTELADYFVNNAVFDTM
ncbi:hypothetical protein KAFR_0E00980 [Kazachstania africana CBS 2517]|uniref:Uncharacterized protein n=1 Tax=Kazachstania africana (strain ATCC 22294 / BCRC 22015 / CBS 2517 / CECT 1963 / NBRC 1671 / NRRL Y-8276) TaxID=1071382 RepID=H2AV52_KAZAF|nr:hypothetical protein KAFR_0E00980 [Kazachstania africana CBS 2517]CCF58252.1 hypothetical protein KAFR_0E00980 [Kazachstania africana CBS 2517]